MQKEMKILSFVLLGLIVTSFLISAVSAATSSDVAETGKNWFIKLFGSAFSGGSPLEGAGLKFLFTFLIFLIIVTVTEFIPLLSESKYEWIK